MNAVTVIDVLTGIEATPRTPAVSVSAADAPQIPPAGPRYITLLGIIRVVMIAYAIGAAVLVLVFASRTVAFAGTWTESFTAGPAQKLFAAIAVLVRRVRDRSPRVATG